MLKKRFGEWVIWPVAQESIIKELVKVGLETFNQIESGNSPEYVREQIHEGFSRLPIRDVTFSYSSWLRPFNSWYVSSFC